mgnify:CR=1 FL=1
MDTKALRQKILDLAIRGKLVPQDPNDEPASVLLERIREQKQQMVKEGKLKKKDIKNDSVIFVGEDNLHYEKFQDGTVKCIENEIPFELPKGWAWSRLHPLTIKIGAGSTPTGGAAVYSNSGIKFIRSQNVYDNGLVLNDVAYISEEINQKKSGSIVKPQDILLNITGGSIGRCALVPDDFDIANVNQHVLIIRLVELNLRQYIHSVIISPYIQEQILSKQVGSGRGGLSAETTSSFLIPIPPIQEQYAIQDKLQQCVSSVSEIAVEKTNIISFILKAKDKILDLAIRGQFVPQDPNDEPASVLLDRIRAEKEELVKQGKIKRDKKESIIFKGEDNSYYEKMADGKLHCLDDQLSFELPEGWEWCNLSMIGTTNIGLTYRPTDITANGIMVLRSCNIVNDQIDLNDLVRVETTIRENQFAQENDILICARNGSRALVGKCALIPSLGEPASFGAFMAIYRTEYFSYIVHYLRSTFFRSVFNDGNSTTINQLTQDMLKRAIVPFPPLAEQHRIVAAIEAALYELNRIEKSLS